MYVKSALTGEFTGSDSKIETFRLWLYFVGHHELKLKVRLKIFISFRIKVVPKARPPAYRDHVCYVLPVYKEEPILRPTGNLLL